MTSCTTASTRLDGRGRRAAGGIAGAGIGRRPAPDHVVPGMTAGPVPHEDTTFGVTHDLGGKGALLRQSEPDQLTRTTTCLAAPPPGRTATLPWHRDETLMTSSGLGAILESGSHRETPA